ncbi:hypothetical protein BAUCODRAFT_39136 [Baudoinia panamericana UAMH 10762]|uniref:DUF8212 domain-containing protein n=1 Tax=Baudoinia panamericana (strain UAMH 10762) TaxID=717646 RepID=M2MKW9_BAUPA|nr:uncharacterized protein BAUCODRAFT_39136 [Baudoinia panamericana UAMH 10762]EMC91983.1 hypothetical protein BAUCODRAFT_39136 [Baudoinia panamericana UAMH 10762]
MRLINVKTLGFGEFFEPPRYVILSHRWQADEVSYEEYTLTLRPADMLTGWDDHQVNLIRQKSGYQKVIHFCAWARTWAKSGKKRRRQIMGAIEWVWIDTCCIDKRSSSELSEAINSMWTWYKESEMCCVYLADVAGGWTDDVESLRRSLEASSWFTRSWTLQELLAPVGLVFCDRDWNTFETLDRSSESRSDGALGTSMEFSQILSDITGISTTHIISPGVHRSSVAERMSWAAKRRATREEDKAYSLMGLFDVNMPLLYGEGRKAFRRLQCEIINQSEDESIFAWQDTCMGSLANENCDLLTHQYCLRAGFLARSPEDFLNSADTVRSFAKRVYEDDNDVLSEWSKITHRSAPSRITSRGILITGRVYRAHDIKTGIRLLLLPLRCFTVDPKGGEHLSCLVIDSDSEVTVRSDVRATKTDRDTYTERPLACIVGVKLAAWIEDGSLILGDFQDLQIYLGL